MPLSPARFPIHKVSATGNDFLLIDLLLPERQELWLAEWAAEDRSELTRRWCNRHEGLGADGLVILEPDTAGDFKWDFYNSDGGSAEMCGNAARAVSLYVQQTQGKASLCFTTKAGTVHAQVHSADRIEVELPAIAEAQWGQQPTASQTPTFDFVRAGVPHAVVQSERLHDRAALRELAQAVKAEPRFRLQGVNVTFVHDLAAGKLQSVTFERGVEDFTLACGTGAVAAAYSVTRGTENQEVEVQVPGGRLNVVWKNGRPHLIGPAKIIAEMRVNRA
jgi:diaminopimelate epimerase